jgi:hypothetical protein
MTISTDDLLEYAETTFRLIPPLEPRLKPLNLPGVSARISPINSLWPTS